MIVTFVVHFEFIVFSFLTTLTLNDLRRYTIKRSRGEIFSVLYLGGPYTSTVKVKLLVDFKKLRSPNIIYIVGTVVRGLFTLKSNLLTIFRRLELKSFNKLLCFYVDKEGISNILNPLRIFGKGNTKSDRLKEK